MDIVYKVVCMTAESRMRSLFIHAEMYYQFGQKTFGDANDPITHRPFGPLACYRNIDKARNLAVQNDHYRILFGMAEKSHYHILFYQVDGEGLIVMRNCRKMGIYLAKWFIPICFILDKKGKGNNE